MKIDVASTQIGIAQEGQKNKKKITERITDGFLSFLMMNHWIIKKKFKRYYKLI
jgi:hypothetical protein